MATSLASQFMPRTRFPLPTRLPRSYFLGHHRAGLDKMKCMISQIDLVLECRDYRIPITGRNPAFEKELGLGNDATAGKKRIIVYTKCDLGVAEGTSELAAAKHRNALLTTDSAPSPVHYSTTSAASPASPAYSQQQQRAADAATRLLLSQIRRFARENFSLTGHRILIAGMPNVGKSTLLNALRKAGIPGDQRTKKKVAKTGADPGITRAVSGMIRILDPEGVESGSSNSNSSFTSRERRDHVPSNIVSEAKAEPVYLLDTPGIFPPYVPNAFSMLKLSLCGSVKDSLLPPITVADYLLFHINIRQLSYVYGEYTEPTNDIVTLLTGVARKTGRLGKGGLVDLEGSAIWLVKRWRQGRLGRFCLDDVSEDTLKTTSAKDDGSGERQGEVSWSQAVKKEREKRREKTRERLKS